MSSCVLRLAVITLMASLALASCAPAPTGAPGTQQPASSPAAAQTSAPARLTGEITVFAASSLTEAFTEIGQALENQNPGLKVTFNFAGSQALRTQLEQGARADVFASANQQQMDMAVQSGFVAGGTPVNFATNKLVIVVPRDNPSQINVVNDLAKPGIKLVLAQPAVPVGGYSRDALKKLSASAHYGSDFGERVLRNLVSEESNVRQVLAKVQVGEADAAIVYTTDVTPQTAGSVKMIEIPTQVNVLASYPIAPVKESQKQSLAKAFIAFVNSGEGQALLLKYGFQPPS